MAENVNEDITVSLEPVEPDPQLQIPEELPLLPLRDIVIYPYMIVPLRWTISIKDTSAELKDGVLLIHLPKINDRRGSEYRIPITEID